MNAPTPDLIEKVFARDVKVGDWIVHSLPTWQFCKIMEIEVIPGFAFDMFNLKHPEPWANYYNCSALQQFERLTSDGIVHYKVS